MRATLPIVCIYVLETPCMEPLYLESSSGIQLEEAPRSDHHIHKVAI